MNKRLMGTGAALGAVVVLSAAAAGVAGRKPHRPRVTGKKPAASAPTAGTALAGTMTRVDPTAGKPTAPVTITVTPGPVSAPGRQWLRISAVPQVKAARVEVEVEASAGLRQVSGPTSWVADPKQDYAGRVELAAVGRGEQRLLVTATLTFADGASQSGVALYEFNPSVRPLAVPPGARPVRTPEGDSLLELPGGE